MVYDLFVLQWDEIFFKDHFMKPYQRRNNLFYIIGIITLSLKVKWCKFGESRKWPSLTTFSILSLWYFLSYFVLD